MDGQARKCYRESAGKGQYYPQKCHREETYTNRLRAEKEAVKTLRLEYRSVRVGNVDAARRTMQSVLIRSKMEKIKWTDKRGNATKNCQEKDHFAHYCPELSQRIGQFLSRECLLH